MALPNGYEVALIITKIREKIFNFEDAQIFDAFFLSHTRIIEGINGTTQKIVLLPEGLAQWLLTIKPFKDKELAILFDMLLWELSETEIKFISNDFLTRRFGSILDISESKLQRATNVHRGLLVEKYGPDPENAFKDCNKFDLPFFAEKISEEILEKAKEKLSKTEQKLSKAEQKVKSTQETLNRLEQYKHKSEEKRKKHQKQVRRNQSQHKKKKKK